MHDPDVVAFTIPRPWPQRSTLPATGSRGDGVRWRIRMYHDCGPWCEDSPPHKSGHGPFPWWRPRSYMHHWRLAGRDWYWPPLITIWHHEPGGRDSGEVCRHYRRVFDEATRSWQTKWTRGWRWHVRHWRIQVHPYQWARRRLLTRCAWCGGRDAKGDPVNCSWSWHPRRARWWQGEPELFHQDCEMVASMHRRCLCTVPVLEHDYGRCAACGRFRPWRFTPDEADRLLAGLPVGSRISRELRGRLDVLWAARKAPAEADG